MSKTYRKNDPKAAQRRINEWCQGRRVDKRKQWAMSVTNSTHLYPRPFGKPYSKPRGTLGDAFVDAYYRKG